MYFSSSFFLGERGFLGLPPGKVKVWEIESEKRAGLNFSASILSLCCRSLLFLNVSVLAACGIINSPPAPQEQLEKVDTEHAQKVEQEESGGFSKKIGMFPYAAERLARSAEESIQDVLEGSGVEVTGVARGRFLLTTDFLNQDGYRWSLRGGPALTTSGLEFQADTILRKEFQLSETRKLDFFLRYGLNSLSVGDLLAGSGRWTGAAGTRLYFGEARYQRQFESESFGESKLGLGGLVFSLEKDTLGESSTRVETLLLEHAYVLITAGFQYQLTQYDRDSSRLKPIVKIAPTSKATKEAWNWVKRKWRKYWTGNDEKKEDLNVEKGDTNKPSMDAESVEPLSKEVFR